MIIMFSAVKPFRFSVCAQKWCITAVTLIGTLFSHSTPEARAQELKLLPADAATPVWFTRVVSIRELPDGSLLVADQGQQELLHVGWEDGAASVVGRIGHGPGEYQGIGRLYPLRGDSTIFTDSRQSRWNVLTGARIVETLSEHRALNRRLRWRLSGTDTLGHVLGVEGFLFSGPRRSSGTADSLLLLRAEWLTEQTDTVAHLKGTGQKGFVILPARGNRPTWMVGGNPLDAHEQALLFPDGWIAVARLNPYRVDWRSATGRWTHGRPLPFETIEVTSKIRCAAMVGFAPPSPRCDPDLLPGWPAIVPPFLRALFTPVLLGTPEGRLVVARTPIPERPGRRYDVINREGELDGRISVGENELLIGFGRSSVFVLSTDDLGRQTIRRHPWRR